MIHDGREIQNGKQSPWQPMSGHLLDRAKIPQKSATGRPGFLCPSAAANRSSSKLTRM
jgi:hypothetical protein